MAVFTLGVEGEVKLQGLFSWAVFIPFCRKEDECHKMGQP